MRTIQINRGFLLGGNQIENVTLPVVAAPDRCSIKNFTWRVAVQNPGNLGLGSEPRLTLYFTSENEFEYSGAVRESKGHQPLTKTSVKSDAELAQEISERFETLTLLSEASANLRIRSMLVSGTAGTGKSYEVEKAMRTKRGAKKDFYYRHIKGSISPVMLYVELYNAKDGVLILDDCDSAFLEPEAALLLKAATDSSRNRPVSWSKMSNNLEELGIPCEFNFQGCVVILTNTDLESGNRKQAPHFEALISRAHYVNTVLNTDREKLIRIQQVIRTSKLLTEFAKPEFHGQIEEFLATNSVRFRELSIRTVVKLAELCGAFPGKWKLMANATLMKR